MNVLVLNCGSSSVKFQVVGVRDRRLAGGIIERIGGEAVFAAEQEGAPGLREPKPVADHEAAVRHVIEWVGSSGLPIGAVGHRVVHGGPRFVRPIVIDEAVMAEIEALEELAPLHNGPSLAGLRAARAAIGPALPMVAIFDTAFHAALPDHAAVYAIPYELSQRYGIRRYGFHGTSYRYVYSRYCALTATPPERGTLIAFHLGNGCSAAAIKHGRPLDTSMGFTPLEGLVMGTRSGDLDPSVVVYLARREGVPPDAVERMLNERSGLRGLSGRSHDMRDLLEHAAVDPRARLAVEVFCYRARKYLGAYLAALGGADSVVFTGGIGEHSPEVRARICDGMEWAGLALDPWLNRQALGREAEISAGASRLRAFVIPTDEEAVIARDVAACLGPAATQRDDDVRGRSNR